MLKGTLIEVATLFAGMIGAPRATLRKIGAGHGRSPAWPIALLLIVTVLFNAKVMSRYAMLLEHGAETMFRRIREQLTADLRTDALLLAITCAILAVLAQLLSKGKVRPVSAAIAGAWLLVPLCALKAVGGVLEVTGLDVWFLPHRAVDSLAVVVKGEIDWVRFGIKCVIAYAAPLALAVLFVFDMRAHGDAPAPRPVLLKIGGALAGVVTAALLTATVVDVGRHADRIRPVLPGDTLPDIALRELTTAGVGKKKVAISSLKGSVVVLDFWASWCNPCRRSMPELSVLADDLGPRGLKVLGINREPEDPKAAAKALAEINPRFPSVIDDRFLGDRIGLTTLPTSYVLDREGTVRHFHMGYVEPAVLRGEIEALLGPP